MGRTPDQIRHTLVHVLNEWAEATPTTTGIGAFARSNWISKSDRIGQGYTTSTPTGDLLAEMKRRQEVIRVCKEAASLMSPTIFDQPQQLPDHLMAIGITIESSVRTKENALACRGFFLDIENGDMTPEDFAEAIPGLEFSACSSWSHTPDARRYRIAIPSTQLIPPEVHTLILHTIVDHLEAAGWEMHWQTARSMAWTLASFMRLPCFICRASDQTAFSCTFMRGVTHSIRASG